MLHGTQKIAPLLQLIFMTGTIYSDKIHNPLVTHNKAWERVPVPTLNNKAKEHKRLAY